MKQWLFGGDGLQPPWLRDQGSIIAVVWAISIIAMGLVAFSLSG